MKNLLGVTGKISWNFLLELNELNFLPFLELVTGLHLNFTLLSDSLKDHFFVSATILFLMLPSQVHMFIPIFVSIHQ